MSGITRDVQKSGSFAPGFVSGQRGRFAGQRAASGRRAELAGSGHLQPRRLARSVRRGRANLTVRLK